MEKDFGDVIGDGKVIYEENELARFSRDYSLIPPKKPSAILRVGNAEEVLNVVCFANEKGIPLYPSSSRVHFYGGTIPRRDGAAILDLSEMNNIVEIDDRNHWVHIEPGVTWGQLQSELEKKGFRSVIPLLPHADRSVLMDWLEREQPTVCKFEYNEMVASMWVVWGLGEKFVTGSAAVNTFRKPGCYADGVNVQGPGTLDFWRFLQGSQGTMGIVTKAICKIEYIPVDTKTYFFPVDKIEELMEPLYLMGHRYIGHERLIVNNMAGAGILGDYNLKTSLPDWTAIVVLSGLPVGRPKEMVEYQVDYIQNNVKKRFPGLRITETLEGAPVGTEEQLPEILRKPWPVEKTYWKHAYKGNCMELIFMSPPKKAAGIIDMIKKLAGSHDYPEDDIGIYVQPVEDIRAFQMDFIFYYNPDNAAEVVKVEEIHKEGISRVVDMGGYFNRIYNGVGELVSELPRAQGYLKYIRRVKKLFDPNNILSSGKLYF